MFVLLLDWIRPPDLVEVNLINLLRLRLVRVTTHCSSWRGLLVQIQLACGCNTDILPRYGCRLCSSPFLFLVFRISLALNQVPAGGPSS